MSTLRSSLRSRFLAKRLILRVSTSIPKQVESSWQRNLKPYIDYKNERLVPYIKGRLQFLQAEMVKQRFIEVKLPGITARAKTRRIFYTLSNLAGHGSFLLLAVSYLEKDFLHLRLFAATGMSLSIIFQYYREKPLWIPIRWNLLFIMINATMIALLLKEESDADHMSKDEKELFKNFFQRRGILSIRLRTAVSHSEYNIPVLSVYVRLLSYLLHTTSLTLLSFSFLTLSLLFYSSVITGMKPVDFSHLMAKAEKTTLKKGTKLAVEGGLNNHVHLIFSGHMIVVKNHHFIARLGHNQFVGEMSFLRWQHRQSFPKDTDKNITLHPAAAAVAVADTYSSEDDLESDVLQAQNESEIEHSHDKVQEDEGEAYFADVTCLEDCVTYSWSFQDLNKILEKVRTAFDAFFLLCFTALQNGREWRLLCTFSFSIAVHYFGTKSTIDV
jgi:CRP-like cAMP-binding protein